MDNINEVFARNLRAERERQRLSLDGLARASSVSKSMLGQIERGDVNPTISTVWKIANGLGVPFTDLVAGSAAAAQVVAMENVTPLLEDGGRYRNYPLLHSESGLDVYRIEIDAGGRLAADAHPTGTEEFLTVFGGAVEVTLSGEALHIPAGSAARFVADVPHEYRNTGAETCVLSMAIRLPRRL